MVQLYGGWLTDAGSYIGKASRGILDVAGQAINTVATRGGADSTDLVSTAPQSNQVSYAGPALIAGAAVLGFLVLAKTKRRRR